MLQTSVCHSIQHYVYLLHIIYKILSWFWWYLARFKLVITPIMCLIGGCNLITRRSCLVSAGVTLHVTWLTWNKYPVVLIYRAHYGRSPGRGRDCLICWGSVTCLPSSQSGAGCGVTWSGLNQSEQVLMGQPGGSHHHKLAGPGHRYI